MKDFTLEQKQQILAEYADKTKKVEDIRKKWHIASKDFKNFIIEMGGQMRNPNACHPKNQKSKIKLCYNCHKKIELSGAKFCPYCGSDIRNEKEILIEQAQGIFPLLIHLPSNEADFARETISKIIEYIKKGE